VASDFEATVGGHANLERLIQAGTYNEALRPPAEPVFPQFVAVPDRNPQFVGREDEMSDLAPSQPGVAIVIAQVTTGMGGIGKTTLAVEHCHRLRAATSVIRWLNAEDRQTLIAEYVRIAPAIGVDICGLDIPDAVARVRAWFEQTDHSWLLVLDNAETPDALDQLVPSRGNGRVLVTTRHQDWARTQAHVLRIGVLPPADAVALLTTITARPPGPEAAALAEHLGYLALAVEQAAAFCRQAGWSFARYEHYLNERAADLLSHNPAGVKRPSDQDITVLTVWQSSIERATAESAGADTVLAVLAYVAPDHFPKQLLASTSEPLLHDGDPLYLDEALAALARYSLVDIHRAPASDEILTISVHRLVQEATRLAQDDDQACATAIRLLDHAFPADHTEPSTWETSQVLEPHLLATVGHAASTDTEIESCSRLLDRYSGYLQDSGNPMAAPAQSERAVDLLAGVAAPDDPILLTRKANLAFSYWSAGRTAEAIPLEERILADRERILGPHHLSTLRSRANLAISYWSADRVAEATPLQEQVLTDNERILGRLHPDTIVARANLAASYGSAGRTTEAIPLQEQVLADSERILGPHHPDTLLARANLAFTYSTTGRATEANFLGEQVLADRERILGPHHPDTLLIRANLAASYWSAQRRTEAIAMLERAVVGSERVLGAVHPDTQSRRWTLEEWKREGQ
jgi:tetratricopeptide (TPR) repeat protein